MLLDWLPPVADLLLEKQINNMETIWLVNRE